MLQPSTSIPGQDDNECRPLLNIVNEDGTLLKIASII